MNKDELIAVLARKNHTTVSVAQRFLDSFLSIASETLVSGDKLQLNGFGVFEPKLRAPRTGRNPKANIPVPIPARRAVVFKPSPILKSAVERADG